MKFCENRSCKLYADVSPDTEYATVAEELAPEVDCCDGSKSPPPVICRQIKRNKHFISGQNRGGGKLSITVHLCDDCAAGAGLLHFEDLVRRFKNS